MTSMAEEHDITQLLEAVNSGREGAFDRLMERVHEDLARMARAQLNKRFEGPTGAITLEPAALVNESFLRLIQQRNAYQNRGQFFSIVTRIMLRVLIDYQRQKNAQKRGGDKTCITISFDGYPGAAGAEAGQDGVNVADLAEVLQRLESVDDRKAEIAKMRLIWSMSLPQIADLLEVSLSTIEREWRFARAWIALEVGLA